MSKPRKRKGSPYYWYDFTVGGHRLRGSTETDCYETAKAIIARLRTDTVKGEHFDTPQERITLDNAVGRYLIEHAQFLKSYKTVSGHCEHLVSFFGKAVFLDQIHNANVNRYVSKRRALVNEAGDRLISDTTINRELETFRKIIHLARDKWEAKIGTINFRQHMLREPEARTRWLPKEQANLLIDKADDHLKPIIRFALLTGARLSNVVGLKWADVDLKGRVMQFRIKSNIPGGKLLELPITDDLLRLLQEVQVRPLYERRRRVLDAEKMPVMYKTTKNDHVFTYKGNKITSLKRSFRSACDDAGISDFRFHDLRHTAASWMVQSGVPIDLVKEILGHTQITTTMKYAHRQQKEKLEAMRKVSLLEIENERDAA